MCLERLLPHARVVRFESLREGFPSRWEYVGFCPIDASIRGWQGLPSGYSKGDLDEMMEMRIKGVKELENVIEDEPHFITKIIDNDLRALTMITEHFMSKHGKGIVGSQSRKLWWQGWERLVVLGDKYSRESKNGCGEVGGVEKISSTGPSLWSTWRIVWMVVMELVVEKSKVVELTWE
ncbi:hypothetical protein Tco_1111355 [Tanacetum coccineum]|uniref:Uncharacterized protein n=1 Tax=Tanacetum coccineum TaxID=301880 RepID=A0ABQ5ILG1_9ASTR